MSEKPQFKTVRVSDAKNLLEDALYTDGAHHKQWYLEELGKLCGVDINQWEKDLLTTGEAFDRGIAP